MNCIKIELRNWLKTTMLDCLMRFDFEDPSSSNFNFERAADIKGGMRNK